MFNPGRKARVFRCEAIRPLPRLSLHEGRLLCIDPRPGNTMVSTPSGRRPIALIPTRSRPATLAPARSLPPRPPPPEAGRPPRSPPHSKPAGSPIPHVKPAALIPSLKAGLRPRPHAKLKHRIASAPKEESSRPAPANQRMDRDGSGARSRYASPPDANRGRSGPEAALPAGFPSPHLSERGRSTCPSWQYCDIGCIFSEVPPAPAKTRSIVQHFPRKASSSPPA